MHARRPDSASPWPIAAAALVALASLLPGCGPTMPKADVPTHPVSGRVVLAGGEPLTLGQVVFVPDDDKTPTAYGAIQPDGSFKMSTAGIDDGAPAGTFQVRVEIDPESAEGLLPAGKKKGGKKAAIELPYPSKYADAKTSGLTVTVKEGSNELEPFELK